MNETEKQLDTCIKALWFYWTIYRAANEPFGTPESVRELFCQTHGFTPEMFEKIAAVHPVAF